MKTWLYKKNSEKKQEKIAGFVRFLIYNKKTALAKHAESLIKRQIIRFFYRLKLPITPEIPENTGKKLLDTKIPEKTYEKKVTYNKELTGGGSLVLDTLQKEIKDLGFYLIRERDKNKTLSEELLYYKNNYQTTLAQLQTLQFQDRNILILNSATKNSVKKLDQSLQRELHSKNNEIDLLKLKIQDLSGQVEELEEYNEELKKKEQN